MLITLFIFNIIWSFGLSEFKSYNIYKFNITLNYLLILIGLSFLKTSHKYIQNIIIFIKKTSTKVDTELQNNDKKSSTKSKALTIVIVLLLLSLFVFLKLPYINSTIDHTSPNYDKFKTYLPVLINSYQENNLFSSNNYFYKNLDSPRIKIPTPYQDFPFYSWTLYPFMFLTETISFLLIVKVFLIVIDVLILFGFYLILRKLFATKVAFTGLLLLAINSFLHNYFFVTVMDKPGLLFFVYSVVLYLYKKNNLSYTLSGLSILNRISFAPIVFGFYVFGIMIKKDRISNKTVEVIKMFILSLLPYILFQSFTKYIPQYESPYNFLILIGTVLFYILIYFLLKNKTIDVKIIKNKLFLIPAFLFGVLVSYVICSKFNLLNNNFITDLSILFKPNIYYLIIRQLENFFPIWIWSIVIFGIVLSFNSRKFIKTIPLFLIGSLLYLVIGSKAIFFHNYYRHIFVVVIILLICTFLSYISHISKKRIISNTIYIILVLFISISTFTISHNRATDLAEGNNILDYESSIQFIKDNIKINEYTLTPNSRLRNGLILLSFRSPASFSKNIIEEISNNGFCQTMTKYNVKYYISDNESDFSDLLYLFESFNYDTVSRSEQILYRISDSALNKYPSNKLVDVRSDLKSTSNEIDTSFLLDTYNPSQYYSLNHSQNEFYFYTLNSCN
ncbi:MAG: hypothetical protein ABIE68_02850 [bacterium]